MNQTAGWQMLSVVRHVLDSEVVKDTWAAVGEVLQGGVIEVKWRVELLLNVLGQQVRNT